MISELSSTLDVRSLMHQLNVDKGGLAIMAQKSRIRYFFIQGISAPAANILKQDALSLGAEVAVPKGVVDCSVSPVDVLLMATDKQLSLLAKKELAQPFGLKNIAKELAKFSHFPSFEPQIMGILNATNDSFFAGSRVEESEFPERFNKMISEGATLIDIGAVSTRPGCVPSSQEEEMQRLKPIFAWIKESKSYEKITLSIDTFRPKVAQEALKVGFHIVNDITGLRNSQMIEVLSDFPHAQAVIMHMQGEPITMQEKPYYSSVLYEVSQFFEQRLEEAVQKGVTNIILDVGIGFGKTLEHNLTLITHLRHFSSFGKPLLVGASRKSMIDAISSSTTEQRLGGTLALHLKAIEEGASIIRCHDVYEHVQALRIHQALHKTVLLH